MQVERQFSASVLLRRDRETLERFMPGLDEELRAVPLSVLESEETPALNMFRRRGGPGLLVPKVYGGAEASLLDMVQIHRALGSRSPSLAIATNMHTCTVAAMPPCPATQELLTAVVEQRLYLASGFAEGKAGASILFPAIRAERGAEGWLLYGSKKPCSLARSMDFLTASVLLPSPSGEGRQLALAIIPANSPGLTVRKFAELQALAGAENEEVILSGVNVPDEAISYFGDADELNVGISKAFLIFELLVAAGYLGAACALVERVLLFNRGSATEQMQLALEVEGAMASLEGVARSIMAGAEDEAAVVRSLLVRYSVQQAIERASGRAVELLGGNAFLGSPDVILLYAASRGLAFHPPARVGIAPAVSEYLNGRPLVIP